VRQESCAAGCNNALDRLRGRDLGGDIFQNGLMTEEEEKAIDRILIMLFIVVTILAFSAGLSLKH
jgi:hypothetical protein